MAAKLHISPWETLAGRHAMLDSVMDNAYKMLFKGMRLHDERMCEVASRYIDADLVLQYTDGTTENVGPYIPF